MSMSRGTTHGHASQSAAAGHVPAGTEVLARTLLDLCAQGAVLFSLWFFF
jgi:hypothetical protein